MGTNQWHYYRPQHGINSNLHELRYTTVSPVKAEPPESLSNNRKGSFLKDSVIV